MRNTPADSAERRGARFEPALRALPWIACLVGVAPLLAGGFPLGHDWLFELVRVSEYQAALVSGQLPPYWSENLYAGYGSPVFLFYAPLFSAAASLGGWLLGSVPRGATLVLVLISALSVPFMRAFLDALLERAGLRDPAAARLGTVFFVLHPYLLGDKLVRNADAEFLGLCLLPIALAGVALAARAPRRGFALVSGGIALVVLAHNLTALVAVAFALGLALVLHGRGSRATWAAILGGLGAGLALSAFFWLPALGLTSLIRPEELLRGKFDFHKQFPPLDKIFWYVRFFATGLATPAVLLAALAAAVRFSAQRRILVSLLAAALALLFLETAASEPIWSRFPWLPLFQFPWRMMGPLALVASALAALVAALALAGRSAKVRALAELSLAAVIALNAIPILLQYQPIPREEEPQVAAAIQPQVVRNSPETVTAGDEYLPREADPAVWRVQRPLQGPVVAASGPARWETLADRGSRIELETHAPEKVRLRLARFAFPGWRIEVDGAPARWEPSRWGTLEVELPAGDAHLLALLEPPPLRRAALWLSGVALAAWLAGLAVAGRRARASVASGA
ncbi:MAG: hypothetical protein ACHQ6T_06040 [Myxococcota bacterium]